METGGAGCVPWARSNPTIECCARRTTMDQLFHSAVQLRPTLTPSRVRSGRDETTALGGGQARKRQFSFEANTHAASARWEGADLRQITPENGREEPTTTGRPAEKRLSTHATAQRGRWEGVRSARATSPGGKYKRLGIAAKTATTGRGRVLPRLPNTDRSSCSREKA